MVVRVFKTSPPPQTTQTNPSEVSMSPIPRAVSLDAKKEGKITLTIAAQFYLRTLGASKELCDTLCAPSGVWPAALAKSSDMLKNQVTFQQKKIEPTQALSEPSLVLVVHALFLPDAATAALYLPNTKAKIQSFAGLRQVKVSQLVLIERKSENSFASEIKEFTKAVSKFAQVDELDFDGPHRPKNLLSWLVEKWGSAIESAASVRYLELHPMKTSSSSASSSSSVSGIAAATAAAAFGGEFVVEGRPRKASAPTLFK